MDMEERKAAITEALERADTTTNTLFDASKSLGALILACGYLLEVIEEQDRRINALEGSAIAQPEECVAQACDYYRHYLCYHDPEVNGPKLEHAAYHHAANRCEEAQKASIKWFEDHAEQPNAIEPPHLERQAQYWENKICA